jgi:hypothetical protein
MPDPTDYDLLDLTRYADLLDGDPADFFVDHEGPVPRVVRHATGEPTHVIDAEGNLQPYAEYRAGSQPPGTGAAPTSEPGQFQGGATVTPPDSEERAP